VSDTPVEEQTPPATEPPPEGSVAVETLAAPAQESVEVGQQMVPLGYTPGVPGSSTITDWRSWVAQQGGAQPGQTPPVPGPGAGGQPYPLIISDKILGSQSAPIYNDTPTYIKPADIYQGWTAQQTGTMVIQPFPTQTVLISRAVPNNGPAAGGTVVQIQGQGFTGATGVNFAAVAGTVFSVVNDTTIQVTSPAGTLGNYVALTVLSPRGNATLPSSFRYT
jgi:hypothetical protein